MRKLLILFVVVGFLGIASIGYADEPYSMWFSVKFSSAIGIRWTKLPYKFKSLSSCQMCLQGNREMAIEERMKRSNREEVVDRIIRHGDNAFTVYSLEPWGTESDYWEFRCYPSTFDPR